MKIDNPPHNKYHILCLNSGSSSLKFALYTMDDAEEALLAEGSVERIGLKGGHLLVRSEGKEVLKEGYGDFSEHGQAVKATFESLEELSLPRPSAAGHRIVHGGPGHTVPMRTDTELIATLRELVPFVPLHLPNEILCIEAVASHFPDLPQVACFDTAFHRRMPEIAQLLPLPRDLWDQGVRRYGFHGLSYEYILTTLGENGSGRLIIAHLGNGASMAAIKDRQPMDTTMGFSPAGGFMMGTRSGDLDPGVLLYLMREKGYDAGMIEHAVNYEAGLLAVSGITPDMRTLLEKRETEPRADQAIEMFCYHLRKHIGALVAVLGGIDTLVFTGGIGEKAAPVRWSICKSLGHLGIHLDAERNGLHAEIISAPDSPCTVRVIATNEDLIIARHTYQLLRGKQA